MGLRLYTGDPPSLYDHVANRMAGFRLRVAYADPARLTWRCFAPEHVPPLAYGTLVTLADPGDATYSSDAEPLFAGHITSISPVGANEIEYVAYDPTYRAEQEVTVMNGDHSSGSVSPRAVFNCRIEQDDDWALSITTDATVKTIIENVLFNAQSELTPLKAAPASPTLPYVSSDMTAMDYKPQDKLVLQSIKMRTAIEQLLSLYPQYKLLWNPKDRKWRFTKPIDSTQVTITLNSYPMASGEPNGRWILAKQLQPQMERRATAVKYYSPDQIVDATITAAAGDLTELWSGADLAAFEPVGPTGVTLANYAGRRWQITDSTKRRMARRLKAATRVSTKQVIHGGQITDGNVLVTRPTLLVRYDPGGDWWLVNDFAFDVLTGTIYAQDFLYRYDPAANYYTAPVDAKLVYAYLSTPITARYPSSGHSGTVNSVAGLSIEDRVYDEMLATWYGNFTVVTDAARIAQFEKLAQNRQEAARDVVYTGGFVSIYGANRMDYEWIKLDRRVNIAGVDKDGGALTTGWEAIDAQVTEVEYDFDARTTTVMFSTDLMEQFLEDPENIRQLLREQAELFAAMLAANSGITLTINAPDFGFFSTASGLTSLNEDEFSQSSAYMAENNQRYGGG